VRAIAVAATIAAVLAAPNSLLAAETPKPPPKAAPAPASEATAPPAPERPPPYEPDLLRLAEMTGALAYLRDLCGAGDGSKFRARMTSLIETEGVTDARRDRLAGAYNRGFRDYETTYRVCTPAAAEVVARYLTETARLAAEIASRYGG
jgi:uncharacterized protein (TIGR02301 family)